MVVLDARYLRMYTCVCVCGGSVSQYLAEKNEIERVTEEQGRRQLSLLKGETVETSSWRVRYNAISRLIRVSAETTTSLSLSERLQLPRPG